VIELPTGRRLAHGVRAWAVAAGLLLAVARLEAQSRDLVLATTTSVRDAGLLDALLPDFERQQGRKVKVIAVGSGQAMELGRRGEADALVVHDAAAELEFMAQGYGGERVVLACNAFVLVGPPDDPAGIRGLGSAPLALAAVARAGARFVARGDRSGTQAKERSLWALAGLSPDARRDAWYRESGQGMGATLQIASELGAYTLTDIGTFLAHAAPLALEVMVQGDTLLRNPYHLILVNPARHRWVDGVGARALRDYLLGAAVQQRIETFGRERFGRALFLPARACGP